jgi:hypothetical protein
MKERITLAALTITGLTFATGSLAAEQRLTLRVTPNVSSAPSNVTIRAYVAPNEKNRSLRIEADSGVFFRSSQIQLDGDKAPTLTEFRFHSLPSGNYTVQAVLRDSAGEETVVRRTALVLSSSGEPGQ